LNFVPTFWFLGGFFLIFGGIFPDAPYFQLLFGE